MKKILCLLLFLSFSFAYFGNATITVEKEWIITGKPSEMALTGIFLLNDSNQHVVEVVAEPPLQIKIEGDRLIAFYNGSFNGSAVFRAKARVISSYDPKITADEELPSAQIRQEGIVDYDEGIAALARSLAENRSSLSTLAALSNWVGDNIDYDTSYSGRFLPAKTVFSERRGVCAEYAHLFIALANAVGFKTRYVAGYVRTSGEWQPHSWAEVYVNGQWISFDPTFREAGALDSSHVAVSYGKDADAIYDKIESYTDANLTTEIKLAMLEENPRKEDVRIDFVFSQDERKGRINISNLGQNYLLGTYSRTSSEDGGKKKKLIVLRPGGFYEEDYLLSKDLLPGYSYSIPVILSFNDVEKIEKIDIEVPNEIPEKGEPTCLSLLAIAAVLFLFKKSHAGQKKERQPI